jgi:hypothetical protein
MSGRIPAQSGRPFRTKTLLIPTQSTDFGYWLESTVMVIATRSHPDT